MNIADKLLTVAENVQKVYEAGKAAGGGDDNYYDIIWDSIQANGTRMHGLGSNFSSWGGETFSPKYKISPQNNQSYGTFLSNSHYLKYIDETKIDFSNVGSLSQAWQNCIRLEYLPDIKIAPTRIDSALGYCSKLHTIESLDFSRLNSSATFKGFLDSTPKLERINEIKGEIALNDFKISSSKLVEKETLLRILNALADKTTDTSGTVWTVTFGSANIEKLTDDEIAIAEQKGWVIA